jgi:SAM-dependent methyltransferase
VLDLGAGAGIVKETRFGGECCKTVTRVVGVDPDPRVLENPYLDEAAVGVGEKIPFADATFDVVFSNNVLEHLDAPQAVFQEVFRVLKPGGTFIAKTPNRWHYVPLIAQLTPHAFHEIVNQKRGRDRHDTFPTRYRANSSRAVRGLCSKVGFERPQVKLHEGRPEYLRFNGFTYLIGRTYERLVNSTSLLAWARGVMIMTATRPREHVPQLEAERTAAA